MGLLSRGVTLSLLLTPACYSPDLRDCTVSCVAATDCAAGQVCGSDRFCAAPEIAGRCASLPGDGGTGSSGGVPDAGRLVDAAMVTADAAPDAPPSTMTTTVRAQIEGQGRITVDFRTCDAAGPQKGDCTFVVLRDAQITVRAYAYPGWRFDKWPTVPCDDDQVESCDFVAVDPTNVTAKFRKDD